MYILFGAMIQENRKYYSAAVICILDGTVDTYKKTHLTDEEYEEGLSVGDIPYVLSTEYGKFVLALGQEFSDVAELGMYYYGAFVRMVLVSQSYGYETGNSIKISQAEYDIVFKESRNSQNMWKFLLFCSKSPVSNIVREIMKCNYTR